MRRDRPNGQSKTSLSPSKKDESQTSSSPGEQIKFLKTKLIDTHSRLMEQLDICKQQEKRILQLTKVNEALRDELEDRSELENPSHQLDNLKAKLKAQIQEKNRLKEELDFLADKYTQLQETSKKARGDHNDRSNEALRKKVASLQADNGKLKKAIQELESDKALIRQKAADLDKHIKQQKEINRGLTEENKNLQAKLFNLVIKSESLQEQNNDLRSQKQQSNNHKEVDRLKREVERLRNQLKGKEIQQQPNKQVKQMRRVPTKKHFDQTQQLIKRLEQAELMTRTRNSKSINKLKKLQKQINDSSNSNKELTFDQNSQLQPRKYARF